jgi:8-oxo-dGTP diphosphatase
MDEQLVQAAARAQWEVRWPGRPYRAGTLLEKQVAAGLAVVDEQVSIWKGQALAEHATLEQVAAEVHRIMDGADAADFGANEFKHQYARGLMRAAKSIEKVLSDGSDCPSQSERLAELVQQWRAKGAQADLLGVINVWDEAADQLSKALAKEATDDHETAETIRYTADVVLLTDDGQVLLIQRGHDPHAGKWAFPGGHVDQGESSRTAAVRELAEETGITFRGDALRQVGVFDEPGRDPRGRYVTVAYAAIVDRPIQPMPGDDAVQARWWPVTDLPELAFDHAEILGNILAKE